MPTCGPGHAGAPPDTPHAPPTSPAHPCTPGAGSAPRLVSGPQCGTMRLFVRRPQDSVLHHVPSKWGTRAMLKFSGAAYSPPPPLLWLWLSLHLTRMNAEESPLPRWATDARARPRVRRGTRGCAKQNSKRTDLQWHVVGAVHCSTRAEHEMRCKSPTLRPMNWLARGHRLCSPVPGVKRHHEPQDPPSPRGTPRSARGCVGQAAGQHGQRTEHGAGALTPQVPRGVEGAAPRRPPSRPGQAVMCRVAQRLGSTRRDQTDPPGGSATSGHCVVMLGEGVAGIWADPSRPPPPPHPHQKMFPQRKD